LLTSCRLKSFAEGSQTCGVCEPSTKRFKRQEVINDTVGVACATTNTGQVIRSISDSTPYNPLFISIIKHENHSTVSPYHTPQPESTTNRQIPHAGIGTSCLNLFKPTT
jgi:hypothetical protein